MIVELVKHLLFPEKCVLCGRLLKRPELDLCHRCETEQPLAVSTKKKIPFLSGWTAVWYYEGHVRSSLLRFKFGNRRSYARAYGRLLAKKLLERQEKYDIITWVPISAQRKRKRGYDQVELIAGEFCLQLGRTPVSCLKKVRHNTAQSSLAAEAQRRANVLGAYCVPDPQFIKGKRVLLLDDIITTGSTVSECAKTLLVAGAAEVYGAAIAAAKHHK